MLVKPNPVEFADFCEKNFDLYSTVDYHYESMSACILDCIYSLRARYESVTIPIIERYAKKFMGNDRHASGYTVSSLINNIDYVGGTEPFARDILLNRQVIGGRLKSEVCYELASKLKMLNIETIEDFRNFKPQEYLETIIKSVRGIGDAAVNYLFMLAGDPNRCKPDVHIHRSIKDAFGYDISNDECQLLFTQSVNLLKNKYSNITVRLLDNIIWKKYSLK